MSQVDLSACVALSSRSCLRRANLVHLDNSQSRIGLRALVVHKQSGDVATILLGESVVTILIGKTIVMMR